MANSMKTVPEGGALARAQPLRQNKEVGRFLKFAVVGAIGAVIDSGTFNFLRVQPWLGPMEIGAAEIATATIAGTIAFVLAVISNFIWNRYWTYPDSRSKSLVSQLLTFFAVNTAGLLLRVVVLQFGSAPLGDLAHGIVPSLSPEVAIGIGENAAWAIAVIIVMFWNFFVNRYWTYNDVK
jgi:putative flippase GtrA